MKKKPETKTSTMTKALHAGGGLAWAIEQFLYPPPQGPKGRSRCISPEALTRVIVQLETYKRRMIAWHEKGHITRIFWRVYRTNNQVETIHHFRTEKQARAFIRRDARAPTHKLFKVFVYQK